MLLAHFCLSRFSAPCAPPRSRCSVDAVAARETKRVRALALDAVVGRGLRRVRVGIRETKCVHAVCLRVRVGIRETKCVHAVCLRVRVRVRRKKVCACTVRSCSRSTVCETTCVHALCVRVRVLRFAKQRVCTHLSSRWRSQNKACARTYRSRSRNKACAHTLFFAVGGLLGVQPGS